MIFDTGKSKLVIDLDSCEGIYVKKNNEECKLEDYIYKLVLLALISLYLLHLEEPPVSLSHILRQPQHMSSESPYIHIQQVQVKPLPGTSPCCPCSGYHVMRKTVRCIASPSIMIQRRVNKLHLRIVIISLQ